MFTPPHNHNQVPIHILCATDENYAAYCGVMLTSLLRSNPHNHIHVHILTEGLSKEETQRFDKLSKKYDCTIDIHTVSPEQLKGIPEKIGKWPRSTCFRLLAPDLLPDDVTRVIYLDCDIIVDTDLMPLWNYDLSGMAIGAVTEEEGNNSVLINGIKELFNNGDLPQKYFNAGVMVMDLKQIRASRLHHKAIQLIKEHQENLLYPDQDALNIALCNNWKPIPLKWNIQGCFFQRITFTLLHDNERKMMVDIANRRSGGIFHFTGRTHPWDRNTFLFHPLWYLWDRALHRSLWNKTCPINRPGSAKMSMAIYKLKLMRRFGIPSIYDTPWIKTAYK